MVGVLLFLWKATVLFRYKQLLNPFSLFFLFVLNCQLSIYTVWFLQFSNMHPDPKIHAVNLDILFKKSDMLNYIKLCVMSTLGKVCYANK